MRKTILMLLLAWGSARAVAQTPARQPTVSVYLLPGPQTSPSVQLQLLQRFWAQALGYSSAQGSWKLVMFSPVDPPRTEEEVLAEVEQLAGEGKKNYQYLKLDQARKSFARAEALLRDLPPAGCDGQRLGQLYLYWARASLDSGREAEAQRLLQRVVTLDATAGPDPAVMPPNLVATFDIAIEDWQGKPRASLLVEAGPAQARLAADCRPQPAGVVELKGRDGQPLWLVGQGSWHAVRAQLQFRAGARRQLKIFDPLAADIPVLEQLLSSLAGTRTGLATLKAGPQELLDRLAGRLGVDMLLLAEMVSTGEKNSLRAGLYLPGRGVSGAIQDITIDEWGRPDATALANAVQALAGSARAPSTLAALAAARTRPEPQPAGASGATGEEEGEQQQVTPWYQSWWFWTAVGVVVAGGVTGGVLAATMSGGESPSGKVILTVSPP